MPPLIRLAEVLLLALLVAAPLAVGSVHPPTAVAVAGGTLVAFGLGALSLRRRGGAPSSLDPLGAMLVLVLVWQGVTLLPVGGGLVERLSPAVWDLLDAPLMERLAVPRLSGAPGATALETVRTAGLLAALLLSALVARGEGGGRRLVVYVAIALSLVLGISVLQTLTGTTEVLWLYAPVSTTQLGIGAVWGFRTTFVNPNHAAMFLELTGLASLAMGILWDSRWRWGALALGVAALVAVYATGSIGGRVAAGLGLLFVLTLPLARDGGLPGLARWVVPAAALALTALLLGGAIRAGLGEGTGEALDTEAATRLELKAGAWPGAVRMTAAAPWTGVGRGAFRDLYPTFQESWPGGTTTYAENEVLQLTSELGLPVGGGLILVILVTWGLALARFRGEPGLGAALAGTLAVGFHGLADFGSEFAGVGLPLAVMLGICSAAAWRGFGGRPMNLVLAALLLATLLLAPAGVQHGHFAAVADRVLESDPEGEVVEDALRWRPCSADVSLALAGAHARDGDPFSSLRWLGRTMYLAPQDPTPHVLAARTLASLGKPGQALDEVGRALERETARRAPLFSLLTSLTDDLDEIRDAMPGGDRDALAEYATYLFRRDPDSEVGRAIVAELAAQGERSPAVVQALVMAAEAGGDLVGAATVLEAHLEAHPDDLAAMAALARYLRLAGEPVRAREVVERALQSTPDHVGLWLEATRIEAADGDLRAARRKLYRARSHLEPGGTEGQARVLLAEADLARQEGDLAGARDAYMKALRLYPEWSDVRLRLGEVLEELGDPAGALKEFRRVQSETSAYPHLEQRIRTLEGTGSGVP